MVECPPLGGTSTFKQAAYLGNPNLQKNPYSNAYNPNWRNHLDFSYGNNEGAAPRPPQYAPPKEKQSMEEIFNAFM